MHYEQSLLLSQFVVGGFITFSPDIYDLKFHWRTVLETFCVKYLCQTSRGLFCHRKSSWPILSTSLWEGFWCHEGDRARYLQGFLFFFLFSVGCFGENSIFFQTAELTFCSVAERQRHIQLYEVALSARAEVDAFGAWKTKGYSVPQEGRESTPSEPKIEGRLRAELEALKCRLLL